MSAVPELLFVVVVVSAVALAWWVLGADWSPVVGRSTFLPGVTVAFHPLAAHGALPEAMRLQTAEATYRFAFVRLTDGRFRAYIVEHPGYAGRSESLSNTHRLRDERGRSYVCFAPEPRHPDQMVTVVAWWMSGTDAYRRTGAFRAPRA